MPTIGFPLLLIPLAIYNIFVFLMPDVAFTAPLVVVHLMSGADWPITFGDALLALGLLLLWFEVARAARPGAKYLTDHVLSLLVFAAAAAEFVLLAPFATSTFFLLTVLTAVEFLAGTSIALRHRRYRLATAPAPRVETPAKTRSQAAAPSLDRAIADEPAGAFWGPEPLQRGEPEIQPPPPSATPPTAPAVALPAASAPPPVTPLPLTSALAPAAPSSEVPPLEKISPAEHRPAPRSVADWNVADLVADNDAQTTPGPQTPPPAGKPPETSNR